MKCDELLPEVLDVCRTFASGLRELLRAKLHGIYLYGATVFPDSGPVRDIDCHVILEGSFAGDEAADVEHLHRSLAERFPHLGDELDAYYILYEEACGLVPPTHQLRPSIRDESWALHCAHVRAGRFRTLCGPEPVDTFPEPAWSAVVAALDHELQFIRDSLKYPDYCTLNLCRILYSFQERNVAVSKRFCGGWACDRFPEWEPLISAAMRSYDRELLQGDEVLMQEGIGRFLEFASGQIAVLRGE